MNKNNARYYMRLSKIWGDTCYLCNTEFSNLACITRDHMVAQSNGATRYGEINIAPAHSYCNNVRGNQSILNAVKKLNSIKLKIGEKEFYNKVNKPLKEKNIPFFAFLPLKICYTYMVQHGLFEINDGDFYKNKEEIDNSVFIGYRMKVLPKRSNKKGLLTYKLEDKIKL